MVPVDLWVHFLQEILRFNGWHYFWQETCQWHPKMLNLQQKCNGLERKWFWTKWDKMSLYFTVLIEICYIVKQWTSRCSISSTTLPSMTFVSKYGWFSCIPWTKPDWLPSVGHNLLRPTSNNSKHTPWDLEVFGILSVQGPLLDSWLVLLLGFEPCVNLVYAGGSLP